VAVEAAVVAWAPQPQVRVAAVPSS
jgi:hypothetical protein